jgi:hypothetical protein
LNPIRLDDAVCRSVTVRIRRTYQRFEANCDEAEEALDRGTANSNIRHVRVDRACNHQKGPTFQHRYT